MKLLILLLAFLCGPALGQTCTSTLSSGADIEAAIEGASGGDVICLGAGTYGSASTTSINTRPSSRVVIRSTSGVASDVQILIKEIFRSTNLTFKDVSVGNHQVSDFSSTPCTSNLTYTNVILSNSPLIIDRGCAIADANILLDRLTVANPYTSTGIEGSVYITCQPSCDGSDTAGVTIQNSLFDGTGACADAIQITGLASGVRIVGNIIRDWAQGSCGPHVDGVQQVYNANVTIEGNYFANNTVHLGFYDGAENTIVRNNIFDGQVSGGVQSLQMGNITGMTFVHNTLRDIVNTSIGTKSGSSQNTNWVIRDNLLVNSNLSAGGDQPGCGANCSCTYNQLDSSSSLLSCATSNNNTTGVSPTFVGGTPSAPSTATESRIGWKLTSGSNGFGTASDGKDRGTLFFNLGGPTLSN